MRIIVYLAPLLLVLPLIPGFIAKVHAQDNATVATVNGEAIEQSTVDAVSRQLQARQQQVDEAAIVEELINMKLLSQLAAESGIDKQDDVKSAIELQRLQLLANAYMREMSESIEVSDEVLQAEYDRQVAGLSQSEYLVSQIVVVMVEASAGFKLKFYHRSWQTPLQPLPPVPTDRLRLKPISVGTYFGLRKHVAHLSPPLTVSNHKYEMH